MTIHLPDCPLCAAQDENILWQDASCRVIRVADPDYPGYCRLIWKSHVAEMSDLTPAEQLHCFKILMGVEVALRECFQPAKINLASLGNMVPHLHWHLVPRYRSDPRWGAPIYTTDLADMRVTRLEENDLRQLAATLAQALQGRAG